MVSLPFYNLLTTATMSDSFIGPSCSRAAPKEPHKPYNRAKKTGPKPKTQSKSKSSAKQPNVWENLTLFDWITVRDWFDNERVRNPRISQQDVVKHFAKRKEGPLIFTQSSLSCHLLEKGRGYPTAA